MAKKKVPKPPRMARDMEEALHMVAVLMGAEEPRDDDPEDTEMVRILRRTVQRWTRFGEILRHGLLGNREPIGVSGVATGPADTLDKLDRKGEDEGRRRLRKRLRPR